MDTRKRWTVTTTGDSPLREVAQHLRSAGFLIDQLLTEIGCITGTASDEVAARARQMPGVADVSPEAGVDIGPPGGTTTW